MDEPNAGLMTSFWNAPFDAPGPWHRCVYRKDARLSPAKKGGRRMRHPFFDPIIYPRNPDKTSNFGYDPLRRVKSVLIKTLDGTAVAKYIDRPDDIVITETWVADSLSTLTELFHQFHRYLIATMPTGRFIGWQPRDLTPRNFFVELLNVECGTPEDYEIEELGTRRPYMMRQALTVSFKLVREVKGAAAVITATGA